MSHPAHIPVLLPQVCDALVPEGRPVSRVIDGTVGAGGHSKALLEAGARSVLGLDLDPQALSLAQVALQPFADRVHLVQSSYLDMEREAARLGWHHVDGILLDLGLSSMQLDTAERGFAFTLDGPLDMRFNPEGDRPPASEIVNHWDEAELSNLFYKYGEERHSRRIAGAIVKHRPFQSTAQLAAVVKDAVPGHTKQHGGKSIHPATRVFQALRIAVNDELNSVEQVLPRAIDLLAPRGRLAVISFHSLEDRIVKQAFKEASTEIVSPPGMVLENEKAAVVRLINRKPITADDDEISANPRSRSAKLRVVEKL